MHTVIVGGGFAGVKTALELSSKQLGKITLISDEPYFLHHATLYATATGRTTAESVISLADIFADHPDVTVVHDRMKSIDATARLVVGKNGQYKYDNLVLAIGVVTTYFGINGMQQHSYGIKTLEDVREFNKHLHDELVEDKHLDKNYVIIGGGPTGIELAGALVTYLKHIAQAHHVTRAKVHITLVEAAPRLLPRASKTASRMIRTQLEKIGVKVLTDHKVEELSGSTITIRGKKVPTKTAIWTSGVSNHPFFAKHAELFTLAKNGRVEVDEHLMASPHIYVIGDNANTPYTGTAWTALYDATFIADHLARKVAKRSLKPYRPKNSAINIPVGDDWGYVEKYGVYIAGRSGALARKLLVLSGVRRLLSMSKTVNVWRLQGQREEHCKICKNHIGKTVVKA